ncbi:MAG TPA: hypothetical protein VJ824_06850 [Bacillota bacterium]|nr:hypothetical protein [Bacillota bacterium]
MRKFKVTAFFNENHVDMAIVDAKSKVEAAEFFKKKLDDSREVYHWIDIIEIDHSDPKE